MIIMPSSSSFLSKSTSSLSSSSSITSSSSSTATPTSSSSSSSPYPSTYQQSDYRSFLRNFSTSNNFSTMTCMFGGSGKKPGRVPEIPNEYIEYKKEKMNTNKRLKLDLHDNDDDDDDVVAGHETTTRSNVCLLDLEYLLYHHCNSFLKKKQKAAARARASSSQEQQEENYTNQDNDDNDEDDIFHSLLNHSSSSSSNASDNNGTIQKLEILLPIQVESRSFFAGNLDYYESWLKHRTVCIEAPLIGLLRTMSLQQMNLLQQVTIAIPPQARQSGTTTSSTTTTSMLHKDIIRNLHPSVKVTIHCDGGSLEDCFYTDETLLRKFTSLRLYLQHDMDGHDDTHDQYYDFLVPLLQHNTNLKYLTVTMNYKNIIPPHRNNTTSSSSTGSNSCPSWCNPFRNYGTSNNSNASSSSNNPTTTTNTTTSTATTSSGDTSSVTTTSTTTTSAAAQVLSSSKLVQTLRYTNFTLEQFNMNITRDSWRNSNSSWNDTERRLHFRQVMKYMKYYTKLNRLGRGKLILQNTTTTTSSGDGGVERSSIQSSSSSSSSITSRSNLADQEDPFGLLVRGRCRISGEGEEEKGDYDDDEAIDDEYVVGNNKSNPGLVYLGVDGRLNGDEYDSNRSSYRNDEAEETTMDLFLDGEWYYTVMRNHPELCK